MAAKYKIILQTNINNNLAIKAKHFIQFKTTKKLKNNKKVTCKVVNAQQYFMFLMTILLKEKGKIQLRTKFEFIQFIAIKCSLIFNMHFHKGKAFIPSTILCTAPICYKDLQKGSHIL